MPAGSPAPDASAQVQPDLAEALRSARLIVSRDPRDWGADRHDAFLFALFRGWDDPEDERQVAERHGWDEAFVTRLHRLADGVRSVIGPPTT